MSDNDQVRVPKKRVSDVDFVSACKGAKSNADVAAATGLTEAACAQRVSKLRKKGVALPKYDRKPTERKGTDVEGLNALLGG